MWPDVCSSVQIVQTTFCRERVVPKNVRFFATQLLQSEATRPVLEGRETRIQVFEFEDICSEVTVFSDSDCAGDKEERNSSCAGVALVGRHLLKAYIRKEKIIARSSAEAELYAAALGASEAKGVQIMMCDLGFALKPVLIIDAKATEHVLHRHVIGNMKHIDVAHLWLQDEVKPNRLRDRRVKSGDNLADIGKESAQQ